MEQTGHHVVLKPDPEGGYVSAPDEFSAEGDPLAWEAEGWN